MVADAVAFARLHLTSVLAAAKPDTTSSERVALPRLYVQGTVISSLLAVGCGLAGGTAAAIDNVCFPAADASCASHPLAAIGYGVVGGAAVRAVKGWRRQIPDAGAERSLLAHTLVVGTAPLAFMGRTFASDDSVSERSVRLARDEWSPNERIAIQAVGALAAASWVNGVVQQGLSLQLTRAAVTVARLTMPDDPLATWWWTPVASASALAPLVAAAAATAVAAYADGRVERLRPAVVEAQADAVESAVTRCDQIFALEAPPEVSERRAAAFREVADEWRAERRERARRDEVGAAVRSAAAAAAYAASGGSIVAPFLVGLGAIE